MPKVLNQPNVGAPPLFIAPKPNRAVGAKLLVSARAPDTALPLPTVEFQWQFQLAVADLASDRQGRCHRHRVAVPLTVPVPIFLPV